MPWAKYESIFDPTPPRRKPKSPGFSKLVTRPRDKINSARAEKLLVAIYHHKKIKRDLKSDKNYFSAITVFATLSRELNDNNRLDKVLDWFCKNMGGKYVPHIITGHDFKNKFLKLELAMAHDARLNPSVHISDAARRLMKRMKYNRVPRPHYDRLLLLIGVSLANIKSTLKYISTTSSVSSNEIPEASDFAHQYLSDIEEWASNKTKSAEWWLELDPVSLVFRGGTTRFDRTMIAWGKAIHLDQYEINQIIKGVNECVSMK